MPISSPSPEGAEPAIFVFSLSVFISHRAKFELCNKIKFL
ncbi:hypothetical protein LEP1GSC064_0569 [Leptospira kirschneri serovar Grippotyphosa str. Moskva]|nr:hypothetical protein LEP1GSC064_0569 [Leptospira kirschneri serovar Grippotyphosa str. Moskva]EMK02133.1 hypothetical protein LEP1GSC176_1793 [Leptospira kirschneri str. MMD1493]